MTYSTIASFDDAIRDIRKRYGDGAIMRLGDQPARVDAISTGSPALDIALGVGGIPRGRHPARAGDRNLRAGVVRQDHPLPASHRRGTKAWGGDCFHRRGARP